MSNKGISESVGDSSTQTKVSLPSLQGQPAMRSERTISSSRNSSQSSEIMLECKMEDDEDDKEEEKGDLKGAWKDAM